MATRVQCSEEGCEESVTYPPKAKDNPDWCIWKSHTATVQSVWCPQHIPDGYAMRCSEPGCLHNVSNHYWGRVAASDAGWFFQRTGEVWCPEHVPEWVEAWRIHKRQAQK